MQPKDPYLFRRAPASHGLLSLTDRGAPPCAEWGVERMHFSICSVHTGQGSFDCMDVSRSRNIHSAQDDMACREVEGANTSFAAITVLQWMVTVSSTFRA
jgi:hypothetical protein